MNTGAIIVVMIWNLMYQGWEPEGSNFAPWDERLPQIVEVINAENPDILLLQEGRFNDYVDVIEQLNNYPYHVKFIGNAIFSKRPITASQRIYLTGTPNIRDNCVRAVIGGRNYYSCHVCPDPNFDLRADAAQDIVDFIKEPYVLGGDFNLWPGTDGLEILKATKKWCYPQTGVDHIFTDMFCGAGQKVLTNLSDHSYQITKVRGKVDMGPILSLLLD